MAQLDRAALHAEVPLKIKSYGAVSVNKTTGDSLREMTRDIIDSMLTTHEGIPIGGIILWSGNVDNIPKYWQLCDGTKGTPNLINKFVRGRGPLTTDFEGGQDDLIISNSNLPPHSHSVSITIPPHSHSVDVPSIYDGYRVGGGWDGGDHPWLRKGYLTSSGGEFTGTFTTANSLGGSEPINNMPVYYQLCYIQYMGLDALVDLLPPSPPTPVMANPRADGIDISWGASYDPFGIDHYNVYVNRELVGTTDSATLVYKYDFSLKPLETYNIRVGGVDAARNEGLSTSRPVKYIPKPKDFTISIDMAERTHSSIKIDIDCSELDRSLVVGFNLFHSFSPNGPWIIALTPSPNATSVIVTGLVANRTYYFKSIGVGINGADSSYTPIVFGATKLIPMSTTTTTFIEDGGGGGGCPIEGTLVTLIDGSQVKIETINIGDKLLSANISTYIDSNNKEVLDWSNSNLSVSDVEGEIESIELHITNRTLSFNGGELIVSDSHTHLVRKSGYWKFMNVLQIKVGDFMYDEQGNIIKIESIDFIEGSQRVYKIIMKSPNHLFYANGILTHNIKQPEEIPMLP